MKNYSNTKHGWFVKYLFTNWTFKSQYTKHLLTHKNVHNVQSYEKVHETIYLVYVDKKQSRRFLLLFSHSVMSGSLWPQGLQHARPPCLSPTPRAYSNSYPLSRWCHPTISTFVVPFSSCLQSFPASGSFPVSQFFTLGSQSIGASAHQYFQFRIDFL